MPKSFINESYVLGREILVYQLPNNSRGNWYCRFKDPSGDKTYIRRSLKTSNAGLATKKAIDLYNDMHSKVRLGAGVLETTWDLIFDKFVEDLSPRRRQMAREYNDRYWKQWFGSEKNIKDLYRINDDHLKSYWSWRLNYWQDESKVRYAAKDKGKSSMTTLRLEGYMLKHFFVKAFHRQMIGSLPEIIFKNSNHSLVSDLPVKGRRGRFDEESSLIIRMWWKRTRTRLMSTRRGLALERKHDSFQQGWKYQKDDRVIYNHPVNRYNLALTYSITILVANSGIRPVEVVKLKWGDLKLEADPVDHDYFYTVIHIRDEVSKVKKYRDCITRDYQESYDRLMEFKYEWERFFGRTPTDEDYIFASSSRKALKEGKSVPCKPHQSIRNLLMKLKKPDGESIYCETVRNVEVPRTLYSFRAMFITERLKEGMDAFTLARACGTSIEMIEKYYDHSQNWYFRRDITKHMKSLGFSGEPKRDI